MSSKASILKLPLFFVLTYFTAAVCVYIFRALPDINVIRLANVIGDILVRGLLYFLMAVFVCNQQRQYEWNIRNIVTALVATFFIVFILSWFIAPYISIYQYFPMVVNWSYQYDSYTSIPYFLSLFSIISRLNHIVLALISIWIIFSMSARINTNHTESHVEFDEHKIKSAHTQLYALLYIFPSLFISYQMMTFFRYQIGSESTVEVYCSMVIFILSNLFSFAFIYFSVRNCFTSAFQSLQTVRLFKSVGFSWLLMMMISLVLYGLMSIWGHAMQYSSQSSVMTSLLFISIVFLGINFFAIYKTTRYSVRRYFI